MIASQGSDVIGIVDFKTKKLAAKVYTGPGSKPHPGQGSSWYNEKYGQLHATVSMNVGNVVIWDNNWDVVANVPTAGGGLFVGTSKDTPYLWADCVLGTPENYNKVYLVNKETLETDRIIEVGKKKGHLIDAHTGKVLQTWDATQYKTVKGKEVDSKISKEKLLTYTPKKGKRVKKPVQPRLLHAEPANHGKWTFISEWTTGRIGIYDAKTGKFIKYIYNLTTPTFTYSVEHRQHIPGA
jgi:nitrite reductase (NO-forming)/hydroxylamine reductase